jgi:hypothetical protein
MKTNAFPVTKIIYLAISLQKRVWSDRTAQLVGDCIRHNDRKPNNRLLVKGGIRNFKPLC